MRQRIDYQALVRRLLAAGETTRSIAERIGVTQPSVSRLATGKTAVLNADAAVRLIELAGGEVRVPAEPTATPEAA